MVRQKRQCCELSDWADYGKENVKNRKQIAHLPGSYLLQRRQRIFTKLFNCSACRAPRSIWFEWYGGNYSRSIAAG